MKVGIIIEDTGLSNIDFSNIKMGNPGVGGTVFEEVLLANNLADELGFEVFLYATNGENIYSKNLNVRVSNSRNSLIAMAFKDSIDVLIFCSGKGQQWYEEIEKYDLKYIVWVHCFLNYFELKLIRKSTKIKRIVFVGHNMFGSYIADDIIEKSTYIYNMYWSENSPIRDEYNHDVCYLGALNRYKGFHVLAKAWPIILKKVPDARLFVIGRGDLYNRNSVLGEYGIAEKSYERKFIKYIIDSNGNILPSIIFKGNLGAEKSKLISKMSVGVVNPTAITETFCISAVEINACGVPVCTKGAYGLLDTVVNGKSGMYSKNYVELANNIITLLLDEKLNDYMSIESKKNAARFSPTEIMKSWKKTIFEVYDGIDSEKIDLSEVDANIVKKKLYQIRIVKGHRWVPSFIKYEYFLKNMTRVYFRDLIYHVLKKEG